MPDLYVRGEGGSIIAMDYPLGEGIQDRLTKGYLKRVNADGSPYTAPAAENSPATSSTGSDLTNGIPPRPAHSAVKAEWVGYAVHVGGMTPEDADGMTKNDLIERFGKD